MNNEERASDKVTILALFLPKYASAVRYIHVEHFVVVVVCV